MAKIPANLQGVLWSSKVKNLDLEKDKNYIINQILAYGDLSMIRWLFRTYSAKKVKSTFINQPIKQYSPSRFNFLQNYLLGLEKQDLEPEKYVQDTPRNS